MRYDGLGRRDHQYLLNGASATFAHDAVSRNYTVNGLNQYTAAGSATFAYDANGNLTSDGSRTYSYDIENRLISASPGVTLSYDPLGRLFQVGSGAGTTTFLYDGDALVAEYDGAHAMTRRYAHSVGADVPMIEYTSASVADPRHLFPDHQGSIVAATGAGGALLFRNAYDEYGIPATANQGRFQYTGQAWIPELGMYYYKARIYSPYVGRFMQVDPVGYDDQFNLYAYVRNDPVNLSDPTGTAGCGSLIDEVNACSGLSGVAFAAFMNADDAGGSSGGSSRPTRQEPGGRLTEGHVRCRSCHGVGTSDERRYTTEAENEVLTEAASLIPAVRITQIPRRAYQVARIVRGAGAAPRGFAGGRIFRNREGNLPRGGRYREYDIDPRPASGSRNAERIVVDTRTGRRWYTPDHYKNFIEF